MSKVDPAGDLGVTFFYAFGLCVGRLDFCTLGNKSAHRFNMVQ